MQVLREQDPRQIGPYRLLGRLGSGGMGEVFLARSPGGRTVAVKVVREELAAKDSFRQRFRREVEAARKVGGDWTARVLDADTEAESPWIATAFVPGPGLDAIVEQEYGPLPEHTVLVMAGRLAQALTAIHAAGLVHRDLKPSNVLLTLDGPLVIDFGIARHLALDNELTRTGYALGSPGFMSPEQVRGEPVGAKSDVFGLGALLAYAATGRRPFGKSEIGPHAQMFRIVSEEPDLAGVEGELLDLIGACLRKEPQERPSLASIVQRTAAAAGAGGEWLPAELVGHLGRAAVRLLDADADAPQEPARASASGTRHTPVRDDSDLPGNETPAGRGGVGPRSAAGSPADHGTVALHHGTATPRPEPAAGALAPDPTPPSTAIAPKRRRRLALPLVLAGVFVAAGAGAYVLLPNLLDGKGGEESFDDGRSNSAGTDPGGQGAQAKGGAPSASSSPSASPSGKKTEEKPSDKASPKPSASENQDPTGEPDTGEPGNGFPASYPGDWENREAGNVWTFAIPDDPVGKQVTWRMEIGEDGTWCAWTAPVEQATPYRLLLGKSQLTDSGISETAGPCTVGDRPYFDVVDVDQLTFYGSGLRDGMYVERPA
ncbi:protein kinase [Streptomyces sp. TRM66268-LWL]|uniref:Protein kinase n=1 Tax=Streptomyces polyasparticus TaxID=2767826 RepID=A0ABR7SBC3_9ACTN|nr:serine/threonine-protein kinase [Streptomyces polyasparticus]MBC9711912.1 protein kinase [Streptomyces polyasparticus]